MSENPVRRKFSRHIDIHKYLVRELVLAVFLKLVPLRTHKMLADAFIKSLPSPAFGGHQQIMTGHVPLAARLLRCFGDRFWALILRHIFIYFFGFLIYLFFPRLLRCAETVLELRLIFPASLFIYFFVLKFSPFFIFLLVCNTVSLRYHHCAWWRAIQCPRTRSTAARQVSNAQKRYLVNNKNVQFRSFISQPYILESLSSNSVCTAGDKIQLVDAEFFIEFSAIKCHMYSCISG